MKINIDNFEQFDTRHIGPDKQEIEGMLERLGLTNLDELINQTIPEGIRLKEDINLPEAVNEHRFLRGFKKLAQRNKNFKSYLGMGYYDCFVPSVIQRNVLENPGWYTPYTPYQAEIAQGRLEALVNFQTMVMDLTGMDLANASLLDEGTAAAEAMSMMFALRQGGKKQASKLFVDQNVFPQTIDVIRTRALPLGVELEVGEVESIQLENTGYFGLILQYPNNDGQIIDHKNLVASAQKQGILVGVISDLLALTLLTPPGDWGADVVMGSSQRFGVPMGYGGPHAAFFATREEYKRHIPGRIIGVSVNKEGGNGFRMALQTREQHIRRERATSNICTAQVLLAVMAGMYAVYHGPEGLKNIALRIHGLAKLLAAELDKIKFKNLNTLFFDTLKLQLPANLQVSDIRKVAQKHEVNFRYFSDDKVGISIDETTTREDIQKLVNIFAEASGRNTIQIKPESTSLELEWPGSLTRQSSYLDHPVFNSYHSEHEMLRYLKRLENKDLSLVHSMISLGSCTMKLNATSEMIPVTWPELNLHPYAPVDQAQGYHEMLVELSAWLQEITGFPAISFQPNSGAQGEFTGLMVIQAYHKSKGDHNRNITLIPSSAHGTNPASAVMAGTKVVIVKCDEDGNIDLEDLQAKAGQHKDDLAALMVTYPSTHGVFEEHIKEICDTIHKYGGQVYLDGANLNAKVGLTSPAKIGADVCHLNLHKTFCIPHGGGGPGMGPIAAAKHLEPFLPGSPVIRSGGESAMGAVSSAPWGSASILPISYAYIAMMGLQGLKKATVIAILNANYILHRLKKHYKILYTGKNNRAAHEFIVDCREFKKAGIEVEDIAKRLMDYGFHAPTVSFPVPGTMMIEPTESENKEELDRFCDALIQIRNEVKEVEDGTSDPVHNVLKNAPHTQTMVCSDQWDFPYSREKAAYPLPYLKENKFWPASSRIDAAYGDRNLFCSCVPVEAYNEEELTLANSN